MAASPERNESHRFAPRRHKSPAKARRWFVWKPREITLFTLNPTKAQRLPFDAQEQYYALAARTRVVPEELRQAAAGFRNKQCFLDHSQYMRSSNRLSPYFRVRALATALGAAKVRIYIGATDDREIRDFLSKANLHTDYVPITMRQLSQMTDRVPRVLALRGGTMVKEWMGAVPSPSELRDQIWGPATDRGELRGCRCGPLPSQIQNALCCACQDVSEFIAGHRRYNEVKSPTGHGLHI